MCNKHSEIQQNPSHFEGSAEEKVTAQHVQANFMDYIKDMKFFDPHIHMTSRTTDDYQALADAGVVAIIEPAFGWDNLAQVWQHSKITLAVW
jgi:hypothetical protein